MGYSVQRGGGLFGVEKGGELEFSTRNAGGKRERERDGEEGEACLVFIEVGRLKRAGRLELVDEDALCHLLEAWNLFVCRS